MNINLFKRIKSFIKTDNIISFNEVKDFSGGMTVIMSGVKTESEAISAEYKYLENNFGPRKIAWTLEKQLFIEKDNKYFDRMVLRMNDGTEKDILFDITEFVGK